jgi:hypothetical protein
LFHALIIILEFISTLVLMTLGVAQLQDPDKAQRIFDEQVLLEELCQELQLWLVIKTLSPLR